jgi:hypothetical protein
MQEGVVSRIARHPIEIDLAAEAYFDRIEARAACTYTGCGFR